jgi:hypothetical protein
MSPSSGVQNVGVVWGDSCLGFEFRLKDFAQHTEITSAFDQYRIKSVTFTFVPAKSEADLVGTALKPVMFMCEDHDDLNMSQARSGPTALLSHSGMKWARYEDPVTIKCKPQAWITSGITKSKLVGGWSPTTNDEVVHYGVKFTLAKDSYTANYTYGFSVILKAVIECKHFA